MFLHHFGDSPGHCSLLGGEVQVEVDSKLLLQKVHDELGAWDLLVVVLDPGHLPLRRQLPIKVVLQRDTASCEKRVCTPLLMQRSRRHLVGQIQHTQVCLYFQAEGWQAGHAVLWPGELMEDDGIFGIQLLLFPAQMEATTIANIIIKMLERLVLEFKTC